MATSVDRLFGSVALALLAACGPTPRAPNDADTSVTGSRAQSEPSQAERFEAGTHRFAAATEATTAASSSQPGCDYDDPALDRVAARLAHREAMGLPPLSNAELVFALRAAGSPHVWPRGWTLSHTASDAERGSRARRFVESVPAEGLRACGAASTVDERGNPVDGAVVVDVLATLAPIPTEVRPGSWLDIDAEAVRAPLSAMIVVLGPSGAPRAVPSEIRGRRIAARVYVDRPGLWTIQVVAALGSGPRPILEALVSAGQAAPERYFTTPAPGERDVDDALPPDRVLSLLLAHARRSERLPSLARDPRLDAVAAKHAHAMRRTGRLTHDVGEGGPDRRASAAGLDVAVLGENVARAEDALHAHRSLWASPSHRANLLDRRFNAVGIGTARGEDGAVWVCELFANFGSTGIAPDTP